MSAAGEYFLWAGGEVQDLSQIYNGMYDGTFTITVEYDL